LWTITITLKSPLAIVVDASLTSRRMRALCAVAVAASGFREGSAQALVAGQSFYAGGCFVEVLGCAPHSRIYPACMTLWAGSLADPRRVALCPTAGFTDEDGVKGCFNEPPAAGCTNSLRALPYNLPGCFAGDPNAKSTEKAPSPPPCDPLLESNSYCAQACIDWAPRIPEIGSSWGTFYVATQAGYACFCGAEQHAERYVTEANKVADSECSAACGCPSKCPTGTEGGLSPAGKAGEMCGGPWKNTTMKVHCGLQWGSLFLLALTLTSAFYLVAGAETP
jgi:hypothetical protein